jgi:hypothetical protein
MAIVPIGSRFGVQDEDEDAFNEANLATGVKFRVKLFFQS